MSVSVLVQCEVDLADLPLEDHVIDLIAAIEIDLETDINCGSSPSMINLISVAKIFSLMRCCASSSLFTNGLEFLLIQ